MRLWEVIVILVNFGFLYGALLVRRKQRENWNILWLPVVAWLVVIIQVTVEGARWHMLPAYLTPVVLTLYYFLRGKKEKKRRKSRVASQIVLLTVYLVISVLPLYYFPVFSLEKPTGPYAVGTTVYHFVDEDREEPNTGDPNDKRELMVQVWYPAGSVQGVEPVNYIPDNSPEVRAGFASFLGKPDISISHVTQIPTHSYPDVELANSDKKYPVLLFSHGMGGMRTQNMFQVEELTSHGYIVVGIDHTYDTAVTVFPDGRAIEQNTTGIFNNSYSDQHIMLWADDASFVLNKIEEIGRNDPKGRLTGRIDVERIGMFGHSYGGALSYQMLMQDRRIKAAIDMDGALFGEYISELEEEETKSGGRDRQQAEAKRKPFFLMNAKETLDKEQIKKQLATVPKEQVKEMTGLTPAEVKQDFEDIFQRFQDSVAGGGLSLVIPHASHLSFTDLTLFSPLIRVSGEDAHYNHRIVNAFSLAFFNQYLRGMDDRALLNLSKQYEDVVFKVNK